MADFSTMVRPCLGKSVSCEGKALACEIPQALICPDHVGKHFFFGVSRDPGIAWCTGPSVSVPMVPRFHDGVASGVPSDCFDRAADRPFA